MTPKLVLREESVASVQLVRKVYAVIVQYPTSNGAWGQPPFPSFDELYDEFIMHALEDRTTLTNHEIDMEIAELHKTEGVDVENGFRDSEIGLNLRMELMNTLMAIQCTFTVDGTVYNAPIQEVW